MNPEKNFSEEAYKQLIGQDILYDCYVKYAKIWNCGDFQLAHKNIWQTNNLLKEK